MSVVETRYDVLLAAGQFLGPDNNIIDINVSSGRRLDSATHKEIGHYIIDIVDGVAARLEIPVGSRHTRHPSVTNGVREAWSIRVDDLVIGFSPTPAELATLTIANLVIDGIKLQPISSDDSIRL